MAKLAIYSVVDRHGIFTRHGIFNSNNSHIWAEEYLNGTQLRLKQVQLIVNIWAGVVENISSGRVLCRHV